MAESAARLCEAFDVSIFRREDDRLRLVAHHGSIGYWVVGETTLPLIRDLTEALDQEAVFEEFRQVGTADKKVGGTGLGLALSRKFIGNEPGTNDLRRGGGSVIRLRGACEALWQQERTTS